MKDASSAIGFDSIENEPVIELTSRTSALTRARTRVQEVDVFWTGTAAVTAGLAAVLGWFLRAWPPHEDEALALFVGRGSLGSVFHTVIAERGGAPLHFVFAWIVVHLGGGLTALRVISLVFAAASVPLIALLGARLAVLSALDSGRRRHFALWGLALLAVLASHPYAVLVIAAQGLFVVSRRERVRDALVTLAVVGVVGIPFWWADLVLRNRFDVGVGGGGPRLGSPRSVLRYLWWVSGDFSAGHRAWSAPVLLLALAGTALLVRRRRDSILLTACVVAVPTIAFMVATLRSTTSPEARHLIFALPFFSVLLAVPIVALGRVRPPLSAALALVAIAVLLVGEVRWAHRKTPALFDGDPHVVAQGRDSAAAWLA